MNSCFGEIASQSSEDDIQIKFEEFKNNFSKVYKNQLEEEKRFEIFKSKMLTIEQHNARTDVSFKKGNTTLKIFLKGNLLNLLSSTELILRADKQKYQETYSLKLKKVDLVQNKYLVSKKL